MNPRRLLIAVAVLLLLGGALWWSQNHKPSSEEPGTAATPATTILKLDQGKVAALSFRKKNVQPVTLQKSASGQWQITQPATYNADQESVAGVLSTLSGLNADRVVDEKATSLGQYGLENPAVELDITGTDQKATRILVGDSTPSGADAYLMLGGSGRVFTVSSYIKTSLDKTLNDLRDKRLISMNVDRINRVDLRKKPQDIEFARANDKWEILEPKPYRADTSAVDDLVRTVVNARMDLSKGAVSATDFARAAPVATATLTGDKGEQTLELRKSKSDTYAKSSSADGIFYVDPAVGNALAKNLDDFRNKKLFDFGYAEPAKIELRSGANSWTLSRKGPDWWWNGAKADPDAVESLIAKLRDLSAVKFVDTGFTHPEIQATVTANGGKQVDNVQISRAGSSYIAQRVNEPALYQIDATAVTDLMNAANAIKAAPPAR